MFVSDQGRNEILVAEIANPAGLRSFAQVEGPDLLCRGPNNSLFAGSRSGVVFRIGADGTVSTFDTGYRATRGVAYDPTHGRLFVVDHDPDPSDGIQNLIRIVPVDS
jgi:hypothetical protein